jgi:7-cyano-7-deazaguanine synthase
MNYPEAIILLSGGLDSATAAALTMAEGFSPVGLTFLYGQRHNVELESARKLAEYFSMNVHLSARIDESIFSSALVRGSGLEVPSNREIDDSIPATYVPGRNILFLSYALSLAESRGAERVVIGVNARDYSGYPDCRPEFIEAFREVSRLGTKRGVEGKPVEIKAPLVSMSKGEIIRKGLELGVDYSLTHSCYNPDEEGRACGTCDSCCIRREGFREAGVQDPTVYYG